MSVQFISTNKNYKRLYASPLDPTISWNTEEEMLNYLTDPTCYVNQIMGCNGKVYIVIETKGLKDVKEIGTLDGSLEEITIINKELSEVKETALSNKDNINLLSDKFDSKINSKFDDVIVDADESITKLIFMSEGNEVKNIEFESGSCSGSGSGVDNRLSIGESEPTEEVLVWIDTSNNDNEYTGGLNDLVIEEFRGMFNYLKEQIQELKTKNLDLEARILYLEENGGGNTKPDKPITPSSGATIMAIEDGSILIDENGDILVFDLGNNNGSNDSNDIIMTTENNEILINEENNILIF